MSHEGAQCTHDRTLLSCNLKRARRLRFHDWLTKAYPV